MNTTSLSFIYTAVGLGVLVLVPVLLMLTIRRARTAKGKTLRPIPAFEMLKGLLGRAAESGKRVHLSLGTGGIGDAHMPVASSGLVVLRYLVEQGAAFGMSPLTTVADPALLLVSQDILRRAYEKRGLLDYYQPTDVYMVAFDPTAYVVGAQGVVNQDNIAANVMVGHLGDEYLLLGEAGAQRGLVQLAASDDVMAQPFLMSTTRNVLLGEEAFAAGAYLTQEPKYVASLYVQDMLRVGLVIAILVGVVWKTLMG